MHALLAQPGHAVTKERLYELVFPGQLDVQYEAIEVVAYRLRKKLAHSGAMLVTLRGLGYDTGQMTVDLYEAPAVAQSWFVLDRIRHHAAAR